jgi:hypothetical protein
MNFLCSWKYRKIKFFIKSKFIIGCSNIVVHTCWCICVFVLFGFNQNSKWIQTILEMDLKRFWNKRKSKSKRKTHPFSVLSWRPNSLASLPPPFQLVGPTRYSLFHAPLAQFSTLRPSAPQARVRLSCLGQASAQATARTWHTLFSLSF